MIEDNKKLPKDITNERIKELMDRLEKAIELNEKPANLSNVCALLTELSYIQITMLKELTDIREQTIYLKGYDEWFNTIYEKLNEIQRILLK
jgi:hypothetical protein